MPSCDCTWPFLGRTTEGGSKADTLGVVKSTRSGETRRFAVESALLPLLQTMHKETGGKGPVVSFRDRHMSRDLRLWLTRAGITRPELHHGSATRKALTWHDLRATGITWMAVRGDDPLKIKQRAGHTTFSTTEIYIREGEAIRDGFGEVFPPLPAKPLLELPSHTDGPTGSNSPETSGQALTEVLQMSKEPSRRARALWRWPAPPDAVLPYLSRRRRDCTRLIAEGGAPSAVPSRGHLRRGAGRRR
jgi:hypothetical protein